MEVWWNVDGIGIPSRDPTSRDEMEWRILAIKPHNWTIIKATYSKYTKYGIIFDLLTFRDESRDSITRTSIPSSIPSRQQRSTVMDL